jgi:hypothetical protein
LIVGISKVFASAVQGRRNGAVNIAKAALAATKIHHQTRGKCAEHNAARAVPQQKEHPG